MSNFHDPNNGGASADAVRIDRERLWRTHQDIAAFGAIPGGGSNRLALTSEDKEARDLFVAWCRDAGCDVRIDQMGNIFARRAGMEGDLAPVIAGSHLDTQATGGIFDGIYGVLAALEVVRALNDADIRTRRPIEAIVWSNEEGVRFAPAMVGSAVWAGQMDLADALGCSDVDGTTYGDALAQIGYRGEVACAPFPVHAAFEAHIEQGPILERRQKTIGVVTGVQGIRWFDVILNGRSSHAGSTPMDMRHDPARALGNILVGLYALAHRHAPDARLTVGRLSASPGAYNTVPEHVVASIDLRHPDRETLETLSTDIRRLVDDACRAHDVSGAVEEKLAHDPVVFDPICVDAVAEAAGRLGYSHMPMVSGAAHDAMNLARHAPTAMVFIPCEGGISHHPQERATAEDLEAGCNVLLHAMLQFAEPL